MLNARLASTSRSRVPGSTPSRTHKHLPSVGLTHPVWLGLEAGMPHS
jgi:hypothetical protein